MSDEELIRDVLRKVPLETVESWLRGYQADATDPNEIAWAEYVRGLLRKVAMSRFIAFGKRPVYPN